ncbi:MAG: hypothetical protein WC508_06095 [Patescibacteria group bacterium]
MRKIFLISFFASGLTSIIALLKIISEAVDSFYGNELFIGLGLAFWFFGLAVGSIFVAKIFSRNNPLRILIVCHLLLPFVFLGQIVLLRASHLLLDFLARPFDLVLNLAYFFVVVLPLCLLLGLQFNAASRFLIFKEEKEDSNLKRLFNWFRKFFWPTKKNSVSQQVSKGYFYQIIGLAVGGLFYSFFLVFANSVVVFFLLVIINFLTLIILVSGKRLRFILLILLSIFIMLGSWLPFFNVFDKVTAAWRFPGQQLVTVRNSIYGDIAVAINQDRYNFYQNGVLIAQTGQNPANEEVFAFPLLFHEKPKRVLLVGGGISGSIKEVLKYPVDSVYYLESDPELILVAQKYLPSDHDFNKNNSRLKLVPDNVFHFLSSVTQDFDVVIVNLPPPLTIQLNRFQTVDFFALVKQRLKPSGLLASYVSGLPNYSSPPLESLAVAVYKSLNNVYPSVTVLPEDNNILYLAGGQKFNYDSWQLRQRFDQYNLKNKLITKRYITDRLTNSQANLLSTKIANNHLVPANTNSQPLAYWYENLFWLHNQHPRLANFVTFIFSLDLIKLILGSIIIFLAIFYLLDILVKKKERILVGVSIIPEFSLLVLEIIFLFFFQSFYGYLHHQLGFILGTLATGLALGVGLSNWRVNQDKIKYHSLIRLYFVISAYFLALTLIFIYASQILLISSLFYLLVFLAGLLNGMKFPLVNKFYLEHKFDQNKKTSIIYGFDLFAASFGAAVASILLLPLIGFSQTIIFLTLINFLAFGALFFIRQYFEES